MKLKEAFEILDLEETATPEEAKKQFRKMSKKLHPDNKETGSEAAFKKLNEAYQIISEPQKAEPEMEDLHWGQGMQDFSGFGGFGHPFARGTSKVYFSQPVNVKTTIEFKDSVLGCQKTLNINRHMKCSNCNGEGKVTLSNGCSQCGGRGKVVSRQGNMIIMQICNKCGGRSPSEPCKTCDTKGVVQTDSSIQVNIPGGVVNGNTLTLRGVGNFVGTFGPVDNYTDAHLTITVTPEPGLHLDGMNVVCVCEISLQEALTGCRKIVNTIKGYRDIEILPLSRHKDEVIIPQLGVRGVGNQRVILDVRYPQNIDQLIEVLNKSANYKVN